jgi:Uma2 family endonuclease
VISVMGRTFKGSIVSHVPLPNTPSREHTMAMPAVTSHRWTADEVRALPEEPGKRFECVDGVLLVSPGPRWPHQSAVFLFSRLLDEYCTRVGVGSVFNGPGELELDRHTLVQPDVFVLPLVNGKRAQSQDEAGRPLLFVEVLSPSTARHDRVIKRDRYQRHEVEYWIADLDARLVERWTPESDRPEMVSGSITWQPAGASTSLTIDLDALFAEALGER